MVNPNKTQTIIIGSPNFISKLNLSSLPQVCFDGVQIPFSKRVKNLGVFFNNTLSWGDQLTQVSRKLFGAAKSLQRIRNFLPTSTKLALAQGLLHPILDYADCCYPDLTAEQYNKVERLQNMCIRFVFGLRKYDHVSEFRKQLKWLPVRMRRDLHLLSLLYAVLFNPSTPIYLKERFQYLSSSHSLSLRSSDNLLLNVPLHSSNFYSKSFTVHSIKLWNILPVDIRLARTLVSFKRLVKEHFLA